MNYLYDGGLAVVYQDVVPAGAARLMGGCPILSRFLRKGGRARPRAQLFVPEWNSPSKK